MLRHVPGSDRVPPAGPRRAASAIAAVVLLLLAACASPSASPTEPSAAAADVLSAEQRAFLADREPLRIGAFEDYPPFGFAGDDGEALGIAADYWRLLGERLDVEIELTPVQFADQLAGLREGRFDSLEGIFPVAERRQWFEFTEPYFYVNTLIYTDPGHRDRTTLESLAGLTVAVVDGDSGQALADGAGLTTLVVPGYPEAVDAVATGQAQAALLDDIVADSLIAEAGAGESVAAVGEPVERGLMTLPVRLEDPELLAILRIGMGLISEDEVSEIAAEWM